MPYKIEKALAAPRWDLIACGQVIACKGTKREIDEIAVRMVRQGLLVRGGS